jgi:uncharacterized RDD family membrane protein YckC
MVDFSFPVAGLGSRFLAYLIDVAVIAVSGVAILFFLSIVGAIAASTGLGPGFLLSIGFFVFFAFQWGYFVLWEALRDGKTPGKRILGLRTIGERGVRITLAQSAIRNFFRALDGLPSFHVGPGTYVLGALSHGASSTGQRIGDRIAGTIVVREEKRGVPKKIGFPEAKYNSFLEDPAIAGRIARAIRADEREVLLELLLRRDELEMATRTELFEKLARHLEQRLGLARERFLSDEKLVMNVAQAVVETERRKTVLLGAAWGAVASGPPAPGASA